MNQANDLITIHEAAIRAERHPATIKRWIKEKRIKAHRKGKGKTAPIMLEARELMTLLVDQAPRKPALEAHLEHDLSTHQAPSEQITGLEKQLETMRDDHAREVKNLAMQIADLRDDKARMIQELADARARITVLEKELNGGFRGLLKGIIGRKG